MLCLVAQQELVWPDRDEMQLSFGRCPGHNSSAPSACKQKQLDKCEETLQHSAVEGAVEGGRYQISPEYGAEKAINASILAGTESA